jgi:membrane-bound lytic murein transglycosylase MltF
MVRQDSTPVSTARPRTLLALPLSCLCALATACGAGPTPTDQAPPPTSQATSAAPAPAATPAGADEAPLGPPEHEAALPEGVRQILTQRYTGDLDGMVQRRVIRFGVTFNRTYYFVDKGMQRGALYEMGRQFEEELNKKLRTGNAKVHLVFVPLPRDMLGDALVDGRVDAVAAQVTIRPELQARADFTNPTRANVSEIVVTGPGAPAIASVEDLAGKEVFARTDSKYHESLVALNGRLKAAGKPPVTIREVPGNLEDDDVLEMVNAGLLPIVVVDDYLATFWKQVFPNLTLHDGIALRRGADLAVAIRKDSPKLAAELNAFLARNGLGTAFGNVIEKRYLQSTATVERATSAEERKKFLALVDLFRRYSEQYDIDTFLMVAQGYQESRLDQKVKSRVGAVGVMQVMPATGKELEVGDITQIEPNIHAGVKYFRFMVDQYFKDEPMDRLNKGLFTLASYNAGPARVRQLRAEARRRGLDPNVWFGNVEQIASERIGRETVTYVSNIYKYYVAYKLLADEQARRNTAKESLKSGDAKPEPRH